MSSPINTLKTNFTAGEISPRLRGRTDISRYYNGVETLRNCIPFVHGGATRRPGSTFVAETKYSSKESRLLEFSFSTTQNYVLELGDQYCRPFRARGQVVLTGVAVSAATKANPCEITTGAAHGLTTGDRVVLTGIIGMTELNNREFVATVTSATTFTIGIDSSTYTTYVAGGTMNKIYEFATPWLEAELPDVKYTQSADVLYMVHPDYKQRKITRTAHTAWSVASIDFLDGPYLDINTTATTITPSGTSGSITLTASTGIFTSTDVGRLVRIKEGGAWSWLEITAYSSSTSVTATVRGANLAATSAVTDWRLGAWSDTTGWPKTVSFFQQRLCFGGTDTQPDTIWGSKVGDYENMEPTAADGTVADDNAFTYTIANDQVNAIRGLTEGDNVLVVNTSGSEHILYGGGVAGSYVPVTPTNAVVSRQSRYGTADRVRTRLVGGSVAYVQRTGRRLRGMQYSFDNNKFNSGDLTLLAEHITDSGIKDMAYQSAIEPILWAARNDGYLIGCSIDKEQEVVAWHRHDMGGNAAVESTAVIPNPTETENDDLWIISRRTVDGSTVRYVEYLSDYYDPDNDGQESGIFTDASLSYTGFRNGNLTLGSTTGTGITVTASASLFTQADVGRKIYEYDSDGLIVGKGTIVTYNSATSVDFDITNDFTSTSITAGSWAVARNEVSGLYHLRGEEVGVRADGSGHPPETVNSDGAVSLDDFFAEISVGFNYISDIALLPPEVETGRGTIQSMIQRIGRIGLLLHRTQGIKYGPNENTLTDMIVRSGAHNMDKTPPLVTGFVKEDFPSGYSNEARVLLRQDLPIPATVLAVVTEMEVNG